MLFNNNNNYENTLPSECKVQRIKKNYNFKLKDIPRREKIMEKLESPKEKFVKEKK